MFSDSNRLTLILNVFIHFHMGKSSEVGSFYMYIVEGKVITSVYFILEFLKGLTKES